MFSDNMLLKNLLDKSHDGVYLMNTDGVILYVNSRLCELLDYTSEELIGHKFLDFVVDQEHHLVLSHVHNRITMPASNDRYRLHLLGKNTIFFVEDTGNRLEHSNGNIYIISFLRDISDIHVQQHQLYLLGKIFEKSTSAIIITNNVNQIVDVNNYFEKITGYTKSEVIGKNPNILNSGRHDKDFYKKMWGKLVADSQWQGEIWDRRKDGTVYPKWLSIFVIRDQENKIQNFVAEFTDLTNQKEAEAQNQQLLYYDLITNLPNRLLLSEKMEELMIKHKQNLLEHNIDMYHNQIAVLFINLDRFQSMTDVLGQTISQYLLIEFIKRIEKLLNAEDIFSRVSPEEFVIVKANTNQMLISKDLQILLKYISMPYRLCENDLPITLNLNVGISLYPEHDSDVDELISKAHIAMEQCKLSIIFKIIELIEIDMYNIKNIFVENV